MALNERSSKIDEHLNELNESEKTGKGIIGISVAILVVGLMGYFSFSSTGEQNADQATEDWIEVPSESAQPATLTKQEDRKENVKPPKQHSSNVDVELEAVIMETEDGEEQWKTIEKPVETLPAPFDNPELGVSDEVFTKEEVGHMNTVVPGVRYKSE